MSNGVAFTFQFIHLADAFIQSDLQLRNTISDTLYIYIYKGALYYIIKRQTDTGGACNTTFQPLFKAKTS